MTRRHNPVDYLFDPMRLIHRAIDGGFIDPGYAESSHAMRVAEEIADIWASEWPEGEGFGSSDFTYALSDFLDALGVPVHFVGGRLTKKNPRRSVAHKNPAEPASVEGASMSDYNSGRAGWKEIDGAEKFRDAASYFSSGYLDSAGLGRGLGLGPRDMVRVADGDVVGVFYADADYGIINTRHAAYRGGRVSKNPHRRR